MTDVTPELLARLRGLAAKWPTTIVVEVDVAVALVAEVERLRGVVGRAGALHGEWDAGRKASRGSGPCGESIDMVLHLAVGELGEALEGTQEALTAPLSAEQGASGQGDHPDEFEAWIGRAMIGEEQGWGL